MRRKNGKVMQLLLSKYCDCEYAPLTIVNSDGTPYCIPISPMILYFHCVLEGRMPGG